jgi:hypothetical protein
MAKRMKLGPRTDVSSVPPGRGFTEQFNKHIREYFEGRKAEADAEKAGAPRGAVVDSSLEDEMVLLAQEFDDDYKEFCNKYALELERLARRHGIRATRKAALDAPGKPSISPLIGCFSQAMEDLWQYCMVGAGIGGPGVLRLKPKRKAKPPETAD